jgi:monofunctional biosynthetic peptidoglycan transglycosylase
MNRRMRRLLRLEFLMYALLFTLIWVFSGPVYMYFSTDVDQLNKNYPHHMISKDAEVGFVVEIKSTRPIYWVESKEISPFAKWAIILSDDSSFYQHEGINLVQIGDALREIVDGARFKGATTITQQMVKNIYLLNSRDLARKLEEAFLAHKVEKALSKEKILEIYLNSIEYGPGIYGIKAAADHYFKKTAADISPKEAAFLAMLLPGPLSDNISFQAKGLTSSTQTRISEILQKMKKEKIISPEEYKIALKQPMSWEK